VDSSSCDEGTTLANRELDNGAPSRRLGDCESLFGSHSGEKSDMTDALGWYASQSATATDR
jgi:hypothetical protein